MRLKTLENNGMRNAGLSAVMGSLGKPVVDNVSTTLLQKKLALLVKKTIRESGKFDPLLVYSRLNSDSRDNELHSAFVEFKDSLPRKNLFGFIRRLKLKPNGKNSVYVVEIGSEEKLHLNFSFNTSAVRSSKNPDKKYEKKALVLAFFLHLKGELKLTQQ